MIQLNATRKGLIAGGLMVILSLLIYYFNHSFDNILQFSIYTVYILGILWTLISFLKTSDNNIKFSSLFSEGFKCFIIITLLMVVFTWIFYKLHPEIIAQMADNGRKEMLQKGSYTLNEMNTMEEQTKKYGLTVLTSVTVIKYLILGALITVISSIFLIRRKR